MLDFQKIGTVYSVPQANNMFIDTCLDSYARGFITLYFLPYFIIGNADLFKEIVGISLNGIKPMCKN